MNIAEQVKDALKEEIIAAVVKAGLADESQVPDVLWKCQKTKLTVIIPPIWRCSLHALRKAPRQIAEDIVNAFDKGKASIENWTSQVQDSSTFI